MALSREELCSKINEVTEAYFGDATQGCEPYGNGHINDTFLVVREKRYILQRMNHQIFPRPDKVMENILGVTSHIRAKSGADAHRRTLTVVPTLAGEDYFKDSIGSYWRLYDFVEGTVTREAVEDPMDFYNCAIAFGKFQRGLADYDASRLYPTIENFHNTPDRYKKLMASIERNASGRAQSVAPEIAFAKERKEFAEVLENARDKGILPLRVTHNDTKLNNILFDEATGEPICVIDLDTVMLFSIYSQMIGFDKFSAAITLAVFFEYPARMAACVAFKSIRYSSQKRCCLAVIFAITQHPFLSNYKTREKHQPQGRCFSFSSIVHYITRVYSQTISFTITFKFSRPFSLYRYIVAGLIYISSAAASQVIPST